MRPAGGGSAGHPQVLGSRLALQWGLVVTRRPGVAAGVAEEFRGTSGTVRSPGRNRSRSVRWSRRDSVPSPVALGG